MQPWQKYLTADIKVEMNRTGNEGDYGALCKEHHDCKHFDLLGAVMDAETNSCWKEIFLKSLLCVFGMQQSVTETRTG